ncbi:G patch domain and ankyrin repeat-containing 1 [Schistosoma japonicum]|uniref:G patch domain and ankyrin repeat-containing 1 n=1 Tax=Schistosoma japonicum TaxID=6182 RepID=Q5DGQ7_SCHJA|nr:unknown [Schistosoma japonicum]KAH8864696.1 NudC domain-containing protein 2 [Schistosoma japonicum]TNN19055.1 G patch domain and ankyrin repeat-containing 1 [Schistosoma japonicum]
MFRHQVAEISEKGLNLLPLLIPPSNKGYQLLTKIGWRDPALDLSSECLETSDVPISSANVSKSNSLVKDTGLGSSKQDRRLPVATILKRDRLGFGWPNSTNIARVTHFKPGDLKAVEDPKSLKRCCHSSFRMDLKNSARKTNSEKKKERIIRQALNLTDEQLTLLYDK